MSLGYYSPPTPLPHRKRTVIKIVDPETRAVINEDALKSNEKHIPKCPQHSQHSAYRYPLFDMSHSYGMRDEWDMWDDITPYSYARLPRSRPVINRITYSRQFLIDLEQQPESRHKPHLPDIPDIVLSHPQAFAALKLSKEKTVNPRFFRPLRQGKHIRMKGLKHKLRRDKDPWRPSTNQQSTNGRRCNHPTLIKAFRGIVNRITPTNYKTLLHKCLELPVRTVKDLQEIGKTLYDSAIASPMYTKLFAGLCWQLHQKYKIEDLNGRRLTFKDVILEVCYKEDRYISYMKVAKQMVVTQASAHKRHIAEEELKIFKYKILANFRFIGELYNHKLVDTASIQECISDVLDTNDEEDYENVAVLLTTIGKKLDTGKNQEMMMSYLYRIKLMIRNQNCSSRVRMTLKDLVELKQNNWVSLRRRNSPQKLCEISAEFEEKEAELQRNLATFIKNFHRRRARGATSSKVKKVSERTVKAPCTSKSENNNQSASSSPQMASPKYCDADRQSTVDIGPQSTVDIGPQSTVDVVSSINSYFTRPMDNDTIFQWVDNHLSEEEKQTSEFIKVLTTSVCKACIVNGKLDKEELKTRTPLLAKYLDGKADREETALIALEELMDQFKHSPGNLKEITLKEITEILEFDQATEIN